MDGGITERLGAGTQLSLDGKSGALKVRRFELEVTSGPDAGQRHVLEGTTLLGTAPEADIRLSDGSVSRYHLELQVRPEGVHVRDLGSTNGTSVEGARVQELTAVELTLYAGRTGLRIAPVESSVEATSSRAERFGKVVGRSHLMRRIFALLEQVAPSDVSVLLVGETGTGKELLARALHASSARRQGPFVAVDCGTLNAELAEAHLFGHVEGAFTGAVKSQEGLLAGAHQGTLFLDAVDELSPALQTKLLRFLETRTFRPLGASEERKMDVRVVASTQRDLASLVARGAFRQDLFFRLQVVEIHVPPLRERADDVALLVRELLVERGRADLVLSAALLERLASHPWPGNVRELRSLVERALVQDDAFESVLPDAAPSEPLTSLPFKEAKQRLVDDFSREYLRHVLERAQHNVTEAARLAGIARTHFHELLAKYELQEEDGRS